MEPASTPEKAREEVLATLHRIFQAFVDQDRQTLAATHAEDWMGFRSGGEAIESGLDAYLSGVSFRYPMLSYEIEDARVQMMGPVAVVNYVAHYTTDLREFGGTLETRIRATDVYRLEGDAWVQTASNLNVIPQPGIISDEELGEACLQIEFTPQGKAAP